MIFQLNITMEFVPYSFSRQQKNRTLPYLAQQWCLKDHGCCYC